MGIRLTVFSAWSQKTENEVTYQFEQGRIVIGRGPGSDVRIPDRTVSETHAFVRMEESGYVVVDNGSINGTAVNGVPIVAGRPKSINDGDLIEIGEYVLTVKTGVAITLPTSAERTASLARRLVREIRSPSTDEVRPPRLTIINGKQAGQFCEIPPAPARLVVGRAEGCQFVVNDLDVSREHLEVIRDLDGVLIRNLDSKNGVVVANQQIHEIRLKNGIELTLGSTRFRFEEPADDSISALSRQPDIPASRSFGSGIEHVSTLKRSDHRNRGGDYQSNTPDFRANSTPIRSRSALATVDILVYLLAAIITVSSIIGLVVLLGSD
jgi:pSer/pThr/pTyr-binding forkhead associated (FHA) protein